jgi:hypothetical protein
MRLVVVLLTLSCAFDVSARGLSQRACTLDEADRADKDLDLLNDWDQLYRSYKNFAHCDDGYIAEGYSEGVSKLLANGWTQFGRLFALTNTDKRFRQFVLKHIDATLSGDDLLKIADNARSRCPARARNLCRSINETAAAALKEQAELGIVP